jgi:hypothetical protein
MRWSIVHRCMHLHALDGTFSSGIACRRKRAALVCLLPPGRAPDCEWLRIQPAPGYSERAHRQRDRGATYRHELLRVDQSFRYDGVFRYEPIVGFDNRDIAFEGRRQIVIDNYVISVGRQIGPSMRFASWTRASSTSALSTSSSESPRRSDRLFAEASGTTRTTRFSIRRRPTTCTTSVFVPVCPMGRICGSTPRIRAGDEQPARVQLRR